jgi:hypothetical protein
MLVNWTLFLRFLLLVNYLNNTTRAAQNAGALRACVKIKDEMIKAPFCAKKKKREPMRENREGGWERQMHFLRSSLRAWGHSARRTGAWPAAHSTSAMKAGCKHPSQMAFEGCAAIRTKLRLH